MFFHWSRPQLGFAIHAILRGWVNCTQFQQKMLISGHVFVKMYDKRNYECIINPDKSQNSETKKVFKS